MSNSSSFVRSMLSDVFPSPFSSLPSLYRATQCIATPYVSSYFQVNVSAGVAPGEAVSATSI
jgi:hypothetical protein